MDSSHSSGKKQIPIRENLFHLPKSQGEEPRLISTKCEVCGEILFPRQDRCSKCGEEKMKEITLSRRGKIWSWTKINYPGPGYTGKVPYGVVQVQLPENIVIDGVVFQSDLDELKIGKEIELVVEKIYDNEEGDEVMGYGFRVV